jgi:hypothetical protein
LRILCVLTMPFESYLSLIITYARMFFRVNKCISSLKKDFVVTFCWTEVSFPNIDLRMIELVCYTYALCAYASSQWLRTDDRNPFF